MAGDVQHKSNATDDLDLARLLEKLFSFFSSYGKWISLFAAAGMLAGFALYKTAPRLYESTLLMHSSTLSNSEQINIIENWNAMLKDGRYATLGERLHCAPGTIKKLAKISAAEMQKLYVPNNPNAFVVTVLVKDNAILDSLSDGIVYGFENNEYIHARLESKRSNLATLIDKVKVEIAKLDSTKNTVDNSINKGSLHSSSFIFDVSTINGQLIGLNEKLLAYQDDLKFANAVQVYHRFEKFDKPVAPKFLKLVFLGFVAGFFMGYLLSMLLYLRRKFYVKTRFGQYKINQHLQPVQA